MMDWQHFNNRGQRCKHCYEHRPHTEESIKEIIESDNNYEVIDSSNYKSMAMSKIKILHKVCGKMFDMSLSHFKAGNRCPHCAPGIRRTFEQVKLEIESVDGYKLLSTEFKNVDSKLAIFHEDCKKSFEMDFYHFINRGQRCTTCYIPKTTESFKNDIYELEGENYILLSEYRSSKEKVTLKHIECGTVYDVTPTSFITGGNRCPACKGKRISKSKTKTHEEFVKEIFNLEQDNYDVASTYTSSYEKVKFRHNKCGNEFFMLPSSFLNANNRCPKCARSKAEEEILKILTEANIEFEHQCQPENFYSKYSNFDFYLNELQCYIEFDGGYHYKNIVPHQTEENFNKQHASDLKKDTFCLENELKLIRIPFWYKEHLDVIINKILELSCDELPIMQIGDVPFEKIEFLDKLIESR